MPDSDITLEYLQDQEPLNQVQFSSKDFPSYFDALLRLIREQYGELYNDYGQSAVGMLLTHIFSYGLSQLAWQQDRVASDCFLETARTLTPVTRLARQIGYKVKPAAASTCDLNITWEEPTVAASSFAQGFEFVGPAGMNFFATAKVVVPVGSTNAVVNVTEGQFLEANFTSSGLPNQRFQLTGADNVTTFIADLSVRAYVDGAEWEEVQFLDFQKTNQFEVTYTETPPFVQFGDGFAGNVPPNGANIRFTYKVIRGFGGNVMANTITSASDQFVVAANNVQITVDNPEGSNGGDNPQSIESIKALAPQVFQSRGAAITQQDYEALIMSFSDPTFGAVSVGYAAVVRDKFTDGTLQLLIDGIQAQAAALQAAIDAATTSVGTAADAIDVDMSAASDIVDDQLLNLEDLSETGGQLEQLTATIDQMRGYATTTSGFTATLAEQGQALAGAIASAWANVPGGPPADISGPLETMLATILALPGPVDSMVGATTTMQEQVSGVRDTVNELLADNEKLPDLLSDTENRAEAMSLEMTTLQASSQVSTDQIIADAGAIYQYMVDFFSHDCHANLVECRILVKDAEGFYAAPSGGLMNALLQYLLTVKEVSHHVTVLSGEPALLRADIEILVDLNMAYVESELIANLEAGIDALLKGRRFNVPLYLSDLYDVADGVEGIKRSNILITGPVDRLDAEGNLIPKELEIVTKGNVTITKVDS